MAHALATEIKAQVHLLPAQECTRENVAHVWNLCQKAPWPGFKRHLILVDQADALSKLQQTDLRSKLEPFTLREIIWVFTATESDHLDEGFRSRCHILEFSSYGTAKETALMLERIWVAESSPGSPTPNFARITKESTCNMWTALKDNGIAFPDVVHELFELRPVEVLAGGFVDEPLVELHAFELAELFLIKRADAQVSDELASSPLPFCRVRF